MRNHKTLTLWMSDSNMSHGLEDLLCWMLSSKQIMALLMKAQVLHTQHLSSLRKGHCLFTGQHTEQHNKYRYCVLNFCLDRSHLPLGDTHLLARRVARGVWHSIIPSLRQGAYLCWWGPGVHEVHGHQICCSAQELWLRLHPVGQLTQSCCQMLSNT